MSLDYDLHIARHAEAGELQAALVHRFGWSRGSSGELVGPGLLVWVMRPSAARAKIIEEAYGFSSLAVVAFRIDKQESAAARERMLDATFWMLVRLETTGVLLFNGESPLPHFSGGVWKLDPAWNVWSAGRLARLPGQHEITTLPRL